MYKYTTHSLSILCAITLIRRDNSYLVMAKAANGYQFLTAANKLLHPTLYGYSILLYTMNSF